MRIIKPGMRKEYKCKGTCIYCDCKFECEKTECTPYRGGINQDDLCIPCPCCNRSVIVKQTLVRVRYINGD